MFGKQHWLCDFEQTALCEGLLRFELVKFSNERDLPLKKGGLTDIYVDLRDARSNPDAIAFITRRFAGPLSSLRADRFIEVPDAVTCFAGPLCVQNGTPYITIREQEKEGRVTKGKTMGKYKYGERAVIIDDVITDGASKILPYQVALECGLEVPMLLVLVDREQGWEKTFREHDVNLMVWSGMTLHRLRRHLIETGIMLRCDSKVEEKNPLIIALDGMPWNHVLPIVDELRTTGTILKVNDLLFKEGFKLIRELSVYGRVMADLKLHDIPNTVANTCVELAQYEPWAVTVHSSGSKEMMEAAVNALRATSTKVLAVTVFTSFNEETCKEVYHRKPWDQVKTLAKIAYEAGAHGLVCSPEEVEGLRKLYPNMLLVTPGIRSEGVAHGDQARVATPRGAMERGANHLVMGRQILKSPSPVAEVNRVLREELGVSL
ncbi:orotidine-5'-phosphate decarboxylase [Candidatus Kaiserbacteria bacterium CG10_big_fil_rev_8_21_14_0_10_43_70]|uniref:Orotidine 5'-phosphate decarboxylase n=1 Tax=Candidatus Kaiserbacteria bacterium CG10_big_fil_rev_8_21_14_0_10_43_70 TaxID=1974605 RepID=A0A2H0UJF4_9BACT|nr:MAG: orotidine-5'-phosphate decarboxylase [Candidatus Kaiserbacteria bacterium CG10_big_fil_rev_8_21_14_0_10_43_70]